MKLSSEELERLYRQHTPRSRQVGQCVAAEEFVRAAEGTLSDEEGSRFADHLVVCSDCAEEYRLVLHTTRESGVYAGPAPEAQRVSLATPDHARARLVAFNSALRWRWLPIAAMVLIVIGSSLVLWQSLWRSEPEDQPTRGTGSLEIGAEPANNARLDEAPVRLKWSAAEGVDSYQVVMYDFESTPIWQSPQTKETSVALPEEVRQRLARGQPIYWRVIARRGVERSRSGLLQFVIRAD
jgi:hypothetical protein